MGASAGTGYMSSLSRAPSSAPSHVYQPRYTNYGSPMYQAVREAAQGLGATPQARTFTPQMPTYSRPSASMMPVQQASYNIPYRTASDSSFSGILNRAYPTFGAMRSTPEQQAASLNKALQNNELTYDQYQMMMAKPDLYLPYVQSVQAGNAPTTIGYQQRASIPYMTAAQRQAYNNAQSRQLSELLGPAPADPSASDGGGA